MEEKFKTKTRDEWQKIFERKRAFNLINKPFLRLDLDSCVAPVLSIDEVGDFPQHKAREAFQKVGGLWQPKPSPRIYSKEEFVSKM